MPEPSFPRRSLIATSHRIARYRIAPAGTAAALGRQESQKNLAIEGHQNRLDPGASRKHIRLLWSQRRSRSRARTISQRSAFPGAVHWLPAGTVCLTGVGVSARSEAPCRRQSCGFLAGV